MTQKRHAVMLCALPAIVALLAACADQRPAGEPPPLETVDVAGDPDFAPDQDPRATPLQGQLAGVLPANFPPDLPLYLPASIAEIGQQDGLSRVAFTTAARPEQVRAALAAALAARGWSGTLTRGESMLQRSRRQVRLSIETEPFGCRYAYAY